MNDIDLSFSYLRYSLVVDYLMYLVEPVVRYGAIYHERSNVSSYRSNLFYEMIDVGVAELRVIVLAFILG